MEKGCKRPILVALIAIIGLLIFRCSSSSSPSLPYWTLVARTEWGRLPRWSPAGEGLLFGDDRVGSNGIWFWQAPHPPILLTPDSLTHNWDYVWSPEGGKFLFSTTDSPRVNLSGIWLGDLRSPRLQRLWEHGRNPSWWNGEKGVLVEVSEEGMEEGIWLIPLDSADATPRRVANGYQPLGAPEGEAIAYRDRQNQSRLLLLTAPTSSPITITPPGVVQAQWSLNGEFLLYSLIPSAWPARPPVVCRYQWVTGGTDTLLTGAMEFSCDQTADRIAFTYLTGASSLGVRAIRYQGFPEAVSSQGFSPSYHPYEDLIALTARGGGVELYRRIEP